MVLRKIRELFRPRRGPKGPRDTYGAGIFKPDSYEYITLKVTQRIAYELTGREPELGEISKFLRERRDARKIFEEGVKEQVRNAKHMAVGATTAVVSAVAASALAIPAFPLALALAIGGTGGGTFYTIWRAFKGLRKRQEVARTIAKMLAGKR